MMWFENTIHFPVSASKAIIQLAKGWRQRDRHRRNRLMENRYQNTRYPVFINYNTAQLLAAPILYASLAMYRNKIHKVVEWYEIPILIFRYYVKPVPQVQHRQIQKHSIQLQ
jgi:hypothetical protein